MLKALHEKQLPAKFTAASRTQLKVICEIVESQNMILAHPSHV
jgi:hypothetical protein